MSKEMKLKLILFRLVVFSGLYLATAASRIHCGQNHYWNKGTDQCRGCSELCDIQDERYRKACAEHCPDYKPDPTSTVTTTTVGTAAGGYIYAEIWGPILGLILIVIIAGIIVWLKRKPNWYKRRVVSTVPVQADPNPADNPPTFVVHCLPENPAMDDVDDHNRRDRPNMARY